jgi:RHS repeat-associated protein
MSRHSDPLARGSEFRSRRWTRRLAKSFTSLLIALLLLGGPAEPFLGQPLAPATARAGAEREAGVTEPGAAVTAAAMTLGPTLPAPAPPARDLARAGAGPVAAPAGEGQGALNLVGLQANYAVDSSFRALDGTTVAQSQHITSTVTGQQAGRLTVQCLVEQGGLTQEIRYDVPLAGVVVGLPGPRAPTAGGASFAETRDLAFIGGATQRSRRSGTTDGAWVSTTAAEVTGANGPAFTLRVQLTGRSGTASVAPGTALWLLPSLVDRADGVRVVGTSGPALPGASLHLSLPLPPVKTSRRVVPTGESPAGAGGQVELISARVPDRAAIAPGFTPDTASWANALTGPPSGGQALPPAGVGAAPNNYSVVVGSKLTTLENPSSGALAWSSQLVIDNDIGGDGYITGGVHTLVLNFGLNWYETSHSLNFLNLTPASTTTAAESHLAGVYLFGTTLNWLGHAYHQITFNAPANGNNHTVYLRGVLERNDPGGPQGYKDQVFRNGEAYTNSAPNQEDQWYLDDGPINPAVEPAPANTSHNDPDHNSRRSPDPVSTLTGNFAHTETDLAIPGRGPSPAFARAYNSDDTRAGALGPGWTFNYATRVRAPGDGSGDFILVGPLGRSDRYTYVTSTNSFTPPPTVHTTLVRNPDGTFTATEKDQTVYTFDAFGQLTRIADLYGNASDLIWNGARQLIAVFDPAGRGSLSLAYAPIDGTVTSGRLLTVTDWLSPTPRRVVFGYDTIGRLQTATDREGKVTTYAYDGSSARIASITDANGHVAVTMTYDAQGRVQTQKDARGLITGQQTIFAYVTNGDGTQTTTITYPASSHEPAFFPQEVDTYDTQGRLVQHVAKPAANAAENATTLFGYDANYNRNSVTDPRGNTSLACYDTDYAGAAIAGGISNLTRRISAPPAGGANPLVTLFKYDSKNNLIESYPPRGVANGSSVSCATDLSAAVNATYATTYTYDATQTKLLSVTRRYTDPDLGAQTAVTKFEYGDAANPGHVTRTIPPRGNTGPTPDYSYATSLAYGAAGVAAGLLLTTTGALGNTTTYAYDAVGRLTSTVDPLGNAAGGVAADHTWSYTYDNEDRLRFAKAPPPISGAAQLMTEYRYDNVGNRTVVLDANGQVTKYLYDERNSLQEVDESPSAWGDPNATPSPLYRTAYAYDHLGNRTRLTRASGDATYERATDYVYDGLNRLRAETQYPSWPATTPTLVTAYSYDLNSNPASLVDPLGQTTSFGYDALDRLTSKGYSDGVTPNVAYTYDAHVNRLTMADGTGTTSYAYDELDRPTAVTAVTQTVGYRYDLDGNRRKLIYPDATAVNYTFDKAGRLSSVQDWASRTTGYGYAADSLLQAITNTNTTTASLAYDNARRLTDLWNKQGAATLSRHTYTLDAVGNRTQLNESLAQVGGSQITPSVAYGYDRLYRLTSEGGVNTNTADSWGYNSEGELGENTTTQRNNPVQVLGPGGVGTLVGVTGVSGGQWHSLAVKDDGTAWAWGRNSEGQLGAATSGTCPFGQGTIACSKTPLQVTGPGGSGALTNVIAVAGGGSHSLALKGDGTVWAWGWNEFGELGDNTTTRRDAPVQVLGPGGTGVLTGVVAIAAGVYHSMALKADGTVWTWGRNDYSQLGDNVFSGNIGIPSFVPVQVLGPGGTGVLTGVTAIAAGSNHNLARKSDGTVWAWGDNTYGELGASSGHTTCSNAPCSRVPIQVLVSKNTPLTSVQGVAAGSLHSLAVKADGTVWAWGLNGSGQLGDNTITNRANPVQVRGPGGTGFLTGASKITAGGAHSLALKGDGTLWAWGYNGSGQLGAASSGTCNTDPCSKTPLQVTGPGGSGILTGVTAAAGGAYHTLSVIGGSPPPPTTTYAYDPAGNRLTKTAGAATAYTYDRADRITAAGATAYTVNANGNLTTRGADTFTYDQANRLKTAVISGTTTTYVYDGDGKVIRKTVGVTTTNYLYDVATDLPVLLSDGARKYVYGIGLAYTVDSANAVSVYHTDGLGSVRALTSITGTLVQTYQTDAFGVPTRTQGPSAQPFRFTGEQLLPETDFVNLRARQYDPATGRFLSRDPFAGFVIDPQSLNRYAYAGNNPVNNVDPSGFAYRKSIGPDGDRRTVGGNASTGPKEPLDPMCRISPVKCLTLGGPRAPGAAPRAPVDRGETRIRPRARTSSEVGRANHVQARAGVKKSIEAAEARGETVLGTEIRFRTREGQVNADIVVRTPEGKLKIIEAKTGTSELNDNQVVNYPILESEGGMPFGPKAVQAGLTPWEPTGPIIVQYDYWE